MELGKPNSCWTKFV